MSLTVLELLIVVGVLMALVAVVVVAVIVVKTMVRREVATALEADDASAETKVG